MFGRLPPCYMLTNCIFRLEGPNVFRRVIPYPIQGPVQRPFFCLRLCEALLVTSTREQKPLGVHT
jgi:hypothetical protein